MGRPKTLLLGLDDTQSPPGQAAQPKGHSAYLTHFQENSSEHHESPSLLSWSLLLHISPKLIYLFFYISATEHGAPTSRQLIDGDISKGQYSQSQDVLFK